MTTLTKQDHDTTESDKYLNQAEAEILPKLEKAFSLVGLTEEIVESDESKLAIKRRVARFDAQFKIEYDIYRFTIKGHSNNVPICTSANVASKVIDEKHAVQRSFADSDSLRNRVMEGNYTTTDLRDNHVAATTETCADCSGRGVHSCATCYSQGIIPCSNCMTGSQTCFRCHGSGSLSHPHDSSYSVQCNYCFGTGRESCRTCGGSVKIKCTSCQGGGEINCHPCSATGVLTHITGVKSKLVCELIPGKTSFPPDEHLQVVRWVQKGFQNASTAPHDWLPSTNIHDVAPAESWSPSAFTSSFALETKATVISLSTNQHGYPLTVRHLRLDKPWIRCDQFLNSAYSKVTAFARSLSGEIPSTFRAKLNDSFPDTASALETSFQGKGSEDAFAAQIERESSGAITATAAKPVATAYQASINNFAKVTAKKTAVGPFIIVALLWVTTQLFGLPNMAQNSFEALLAYSLVPPIITLLAIRWLIKRAIKKEAGTSNVKVVGVEALVIPASTLVIFGMTAYLNLNLLPPLLRDIMLMPH